MSAMSIGGLLCKKSRSLLEPEHSTPKSLMKSIRWIVEYKAATKEIDSAAFKETA